MTRRRTAGRPTPRLRKTRQRDPSPPCAHHPKPNQQEEGPRERLHSNPLDPRRCRSGLGCADRTRRASVSPDRLHNRHLRRQQRRPDPRRARHCHRHPEQCRHGSPHDPRCSNAPWPQSAAVAHSRPCPRTPPTCPTTASPECRLTTGEQEQAPTASGGAPGRRTGLPLPARYRQLSNGCSDPISRGLRRSRRFPRRG